MSKTADCNRDFIEVKDQINKYSIEELNQTAEEYFRRLDNWDRLLAKPFASPIEAPHMLVQMSYLLQGLDLYPGMTVVDFGAGSGWASKILNQMGLEVITLDVSATALKIGEELSRQHPVFGAQPPHRFLLFDGWKIGLENASVDRIFCFDAFHHVPNQEKVLGEMSRILRDGGIAGFSEPGPCHSKDPVSQFEMRSFKVIENDIVLEDIFEKAKGVGFTDVAVSIGSTYPLRVSLDQFTTFLTDEKLTTEFLRSTEQRVKNFPIFFLYKGRVPINDSRNMEGLIAEIVTGQDSLSVKSGEGAKVEVVVHNTSTRYWLRSGGQYGCVNLGYFVHKVGENGTLVKTSEFRSHLSDTGVKPGERIRTVIDLKGLEEGKYRVDVDLVSEHVRWFQWNGSKIVSIEIIVD